MRARFAYISSLGTTAILVAAALMMLALVSAIVAFRGWPGSATQGGVQTVPLAPHGTAERVALVRRTAPVRGIERSGRRVTRSVSTRAVVSTAGLVKSKASGPRVVPGLVMDPAPSATMQPTTGRSAQGQVTAPVAPVEPAPQRPVPDPSTSPPPPLPGGSVDIPLPGGGTGIPVPAPAASPSADQVTTMVGTLLGGAPPPPLLTTLGIR